jgi:hypothetical protein
VFYESNASFSKSGIKFNVYFMNSLNARESTLQRKGIKAKRANTNVTNAAKNDTRLSPERGQPHTMKQISQHPYHFL